MPGHDIIVIGASAGGVEAVATLLKGLPPDLPAALFVVLHIPAQSPSTLPAIFSRAGALPAFHALNEAKIEYGRVYVAPPDHHLLIDKGVIKVVRGPKENRHRPAVDPLFRSAAAAYGPRVIGVVLTGSLDDGTAGLIAVKRQGGIAVVQDPKDALYSSMPLSAIQHVEVDYVLPLAKMAAKLVELVHTETEGEGAFPVPDDMDKENKITMMDPERVHADHFPGTPSAFSCPECGGVLWELQDGELLRFRCRVGHAFSPESVLAEQSEALEEALWTALKTLEESASLSDRMAEDARQRNQRWLANRYDERARETQKRAETIRQVLTKDTFLTFNGSQDEDENPEQEERAG